MSSPTDLAPGTIFGREFRVLRALKTGGMGAVYVVEQLSTGKQRALKVMAPELTMDELARERFVREARVGSQIESQHVVEVVTAGVDEATGVPYLVMELLKGEELGDVLERERRLPLGDVAALMEQVGHALEQAHRQGIVHRDLKPENIFVGVPRSRGGAAFDVKILDFGIAKLVADRQGAGTQALGTPLFMPPEQTSKGATISPASDVWSLGLIVYRLLVGADFWKETDSIAMLLREICVDDIPKASVRAAEHAAQHLLPTGFDAWFERCVNRDLSKRFPDAGEAVRAFQALVPGDAQKGKLVVKATASQEMIDVSAPTLASTELATNAALAKSAEAARPLVEAPVAKKSGAVVPIAIGALVVGAAVAGVLLTRGGDKPSTPGPTSSAKETTKASVAPPAASSAAQPKTGCAANMTFVAGGNMFMGTKEGTNDDAKPPHKVTVSAFCIDQFEVSTGEYEACVQGGNCLKATQDVSFPDFSKQEKAAYSSLCNTRRPGREKHPINCVDWSMANEYCKAQGKRLPREAEWEFAARGSGQRTYPWGDEEPSPDRLNACGKECLKWMFDHDLGAVKPMFLGDDKWPATAPIGSFPKGATPTGIHDLAGNVCEWTADWFAPYGADAQTDPKGPESGTERVVRGGAFNASMPDWAKPSYRWKTTPDTYGHAIGFRCAADPT